MCESDRRYPNNHFGTELNRKFVEITSAVLGVGGDPTALVTEVLRQISQTREAGADPATGKGVTKSGPED
jgi:hypothetical protein